MKTCLASMASLSASARAVSSAMRRTTESYRPREYASKAEWRTAITMMTTTMTAMTSAAFISSKVPGKEGAG